MTRNEQRIYRRLWWGNRIIVLGTLFFAAGLGFGVIAIWSHGHDTVTRWGGTAGLFAGLGFLLMVVGGLIGYAGT